MHVFLGHGKTPAGNRAGAASVLFVMSWKRVSAGPSERGFRDAMTLEERGWWTRKEADEGKECGSERKRHKKC